MECYASAYVQVHNDQTLRSFGARSRVAECEVKSCQEKVLIYLILMRRLAAYYKHCFATQGTNFLI